MEWLIFTGMLIGAFFVGSIPFGLILAKRKGVDIRQHGSGNIGATNVYRVLGKDAGLLVFLLDVLKGLGPAVAVLYMFGRQELAVAAGALAVVGHCLSPFLGFRGGKGIATGLGMLLGSAPLVALTAFAIFFVLMLFTRYVSLSSIIAAASLPLLGLAYGDPLPLFVAYLLLAPFIVYRHRANIARLRQGTEPKFSFGGKPIAADSAVAVAADEGSRGALLLLSGVSLALLIALVALSVRLVAQ
jgi:acyl phosphate:glycerol-3-phosphate acyltransferase